MAAKSTFAQRFEFARARQHALGTWRDDQMMAADLGVAPSRITEYKTRDEAPPVGRTLEIAKWCDVDPGWLAFGEDSQAPFPGGWTVWLQNKTVRAAALEQPPIPAERPSAKKQRRKGA